MKTKKSMEDKNKRKMWNRDQHIALNPLKAGINTSTDFVKLPSVIIQAISSILSTSIFKPEKQQTELDKFAYLSMSLHPIPSDEFNIKKNIDLVMDKSYLSGWYTWVWKIIYEDIQRLYQLKSIYVRNKTVSKQGQRQGSVYYYEGRARENECLLEM